MTVGRLGPASGQALWLTLFPPRLTSLFKATCFPIYVVYHRVLQAQRNNRSIVATREDTHHSSVGPRAQECSCGTCCTHTERYHVFVHAYSPALLFHPGFVHCTSTCNRTFYLLCLCRVSSIIFFCFLFVELIITRVVYKPSKKNLLIIGASFGVRHDKNFAFFIYLQFRRINITVSHSSHLLMLQYSVLSYACSTSAR